MAEQSADEALGATDVPPTRTQVVAHGPAYLFGRPLGQILVQSFGLLERKLEEALKAQIEKADAWAKCSSA